MNATAPTATSDARPAPSRRSPVSVKLVSKQEELAAVLNIRRMVFQDELLHAPDSIFDPLDTWPLQSGVYHLLVSVAGRPIATCRINSIAGYGVKLEHVAVIQLARRKGVGLALLSHVERLEFVQGSRGPLFCEALPDNEMFFRNSGWVVEEGHDRPDDILKRLTMIRRRPPLGVSSASKLSLSHSMIYSLDLARSRRFYSLLGYQDVSRFKMGEVKGVWVNSNYIDLKLELLEVKLLPKHEPQSPSAGRLHVGGAGGSTVLGTGSPRHTESGTTRNSGTAPQEHANGHGSAAMNGAGNATGNVGGDIGGATHMGPSHGGPGTHRSSNGPTANSSVRRNEIRAGTIGHISMDVSRACTSIGCLLPTLQKESFERFETSIRIVQRPRQIVLGTLLAEVAFIADPDGTLIELIRAVGTVRGREDDGSYHAAFHASAAIRPATGGGSLATRPE